jgi:hypothetical protein
MELKTLHHVYIMVLTLQYAQFLVLYNALKRREQIWQVLWLHSETAKVATGSVQMKQSSPSSSSSSGTDFCCLDVSIEMEYEESEIKIDFAIIFNFFFYIHILFCWRRSTVQAGAIGFTLHLTVSI